jgi:hypothetical protein
MRVPLSPFLSFGHSQMPPLVLLAEADADDDDAEDAGVDDADADTDDAGLEGLGLQKQRGWRGSHGQRPGPLTNLASRPPSARGSATEATAKSARRAKMDVRIYIIVVYG